jgi:hypothetical protein
MCGVDILRFKRALIFLCALILACLFVSGSLNVSASSEADAGSAIAAAQGRVDDCYTAVSEAAKAGANVTSLLIRLNDAGKLLSAANLAYNAGNFDSAREFAVESQTRLNGFVEEANASGENSLNEQYWNFMVNVVGSLTGTAAVVLGGFVVWRLLKRKYGRAWQAV